jgi:ankyrin repeat protein
MKRERSFSSASVIRQFLEHGTAVNAVGEDGKSLLHYVSELQGDDVLECVRFLLKSGIPVDIRDFRGETPLMRAAYCGKLATVQLLLENGASLKARSNSEHSVLMRAAIGEKGNTVKFLLGKGASITVEELRTLQWKKEDMIKAGFYWELQEAAYR